MRRLGPYMTAFAAAAYAWGCAVVPEPAPEPTPVPAAQTPVKAAPVEVATTATGGGITSRAESAAVIDSTPSSEALRVLATIPEPIPAAERVPPPDEVMRRYPPAATGAAAAGSAMLLADASGRGANEADSTAADSSAADTSMIPVPAPTQPLGLRRRPQPSATDSLLEAAMRDTTRRDTTARDSAARAMPAAQQVHPDSCWRVQVAAPEDAKRAADLRRAAESILLVPMVIEPEDGLYKVRTHDCVNAVTANRLRIRADASGFPGAFRFKKR